MNYKDQGFKNIGGAIPLRFKQIAVSAALSESDSSERLIGLAEDGSVWEYRCRAIPKTRMVPYKGDTTQMMEQRYNEYLYFWQPLRMSTEPGPESEEPAS